MRAVTRPTTSSASWPFVVLVAHVGVVWLWHAPALYEAALGSAWLHGLEHATFFVTALAFWSVVIHAGRRALSPVAAVVYVFVAALHGGALGALLTFAPAPLYAGYAASSAAWGRDLLADQHLGGLLMWIPGSLVYVAAALWLLATGLLRLDRRLPHAPPHAGGPT